MAVWLGALALAALGVAYVLLGVHRRGAGDPQQRDARAVFADRAREIHAEGLAQGLAEEQVAALQQELALDLLAGAATEHAPASARRPARQPLVLLAVAALIGALALGLYGWWGDPDAPAVLSALEHLAEDDTEQLRALAPVLTRRADRRPNDANIWLQLAGVRMRLADYDGAAAAFAAAHGLVGADEQVDLAWAQARFLADGGTVSAATRQIAERVLATAPNQPAMLELLAMGDLRTGRFAAAARHLASLLRQDVPAERRRLLARTLALARERQGADRAFIEVAVKAAGVSAVADADAPWLMVFARPVGGGAPLAVARQRARERQTVVLDDANAMVAGKPLSTSGMVEVVARLSRTGNATDADAQAVSKPVDPATRPRVELTLRGGAANTAGGEGVGVAVRVTIGANVAANTPVFVIARAVAGTGPPLAVRRLRVADLPARVVLTDADAMLPGQRLAAGEDVEVLARASLGGAPSARSGDIESGAVRAKVGASGEPVRLHIEHVVP